MAQRDTAREAAHDVGAFLERRREQIAQRWADATLFRTVFTVSRDEAVEASRSVVDALAEVARSGRLEDILASGFGAVREQLGRMAAARGRTGAVPARIAAEVAELREPAAELLRAEAPARPAAPTHDLLLAWALLMGTLRLAVMAAALTTGDEPAARQRRQLLETATPVIEVWEGIVAVPLIGTLDSARGQAVMANLLEAVVARRVRYAILDITGVPAVDTLAARHILQTAAATRLTGAECVVSGIRPAIAQTIVGLGIDLGTIVTRARLADALQYALDGQGVIVSPAPGS
ncbi:STAS domain-containing protein [Streptomyces sp. NPDC096012]|uniref:STAS domain-containing protein n=1 Tax=Streptomyces sp. NPDC096012 TaxID=3155684 RepID=UPI003369ED16